MIQLVLYEERNVKNLLKNISFAKNLRKIMDERGLTGAELGGKLEVSKGTVIHWSNGTRFPNEKSIRKIASILNVDYNDLFEGENEIKISKKIPLIGLAHCGEPAVYDLDGYEPLFVPDDIYKEGMYAVKSEGDSMLPKIADGDTLYCLSESITHIDSGDIVHYKIDGDSGIKKYKINEQGTVISLIPLNSDYDIITIHCDDCVQLRMAKVVGSYREF